MAVNDMAILNIWKDTQMKAIVYSKLGPLDVFQLKEVRKPAPKDNEVLIKIFSTTVVKEDPDMRASPGINGLLKPRIPIVGQELAGKVRETKILSLF